MSDQIDVLVVGAGPTGLLLACTLAKQGVSFRVIDRLVAPRNISKASGVMPRTLEILHGIGVAERFVEAGNRVDTLTLMSRHQKLRSPHDQSHGTLPKPILEVGFDHLDSPYSFILGLEQFRTEALLASRLGELDGRIERGVELTDFVESGDGVSATLKDSGGRTEEARFRFIVGCDGAHSTVRHKLGLPFEGSEDADHYVVGYVKIDWAMPSNKMFEFNSPEGTIFGIPLPDGRWSVASEYDRSQWKHDEEEEPELQELQGLFDRRAPLPSRLSDPRWMSYYRVNHRQVPSYRAGRAFLAGDAAHVHSPVGGQGMNTGLQDAANLAWKLGFVCRGLSGEELLDSYHSERYPVGRSVVQMTSFLQAELNLRSRIAMALRDEMTGMVGHINYIRNLASRQLGELACHYRHSPIVAEWQAGTRFHAHHAHHIDFSECPEFAAGPHAGDRAPNAAAVTPGADGRARTTTLYDLLDPTRYTLLLFEGTHADTEGNDGVEQLAAIARRVRESMGTAIEPVILSARQSVSGRADGAAVELHDAEAMFHHRYGARGRCLYLIRPDGYVGYRSEPADRQKLLEWLRVPGVAVSGT